MTDREDGAKVRVKRQPLQALPQCAVCLTAHPGANAGTRLHESQNRHQWRCSHCGLSSVVHLVRSQGADLCRVTTTIPKVGSVGAKPEPGRPVDHFGYFDEHGNAQAPQGYKAELGHAPVCPTCRRRSCGTIGDLFRKLDAGRPFLAIQVRCDVCMNGIRFTKLPRDPGNCLAWAIPHQDRTLPEGEVIYG